MGVQGWPLKLIQHIANATCIPPSPAGQRSSCPLHLLYLSNLSFCLAHLSRRLIGELIVNEGIRRPSVVHPSSVRRPSVVRLSTFSNDIFSEAMRPILFIFHI